MTRVHESMTIGIGNPPEIGPTTFDVTHFQFPGRHGRTLPGAQGEGRTRGQDGRRPGQRRRPRRRRQAQRHDGKQLRVVTCATAAGGGEELRSKVGSKLVNCQLNEDVVTLLEKVLLTFSFMLNRLVL